MPTNNFKKTKYLLLLILLLGAFLRFYDLGEYSFSADEFLDINSTYGYSQTGTWQAWDFNLEKPQENDQNFDRDSRAWIYKWPVAQIFKVTATTESAGRAMSALWGVLSILLIYFVAFKFTKNKTVGLLSAFFLAASIDAIEFSRTLRMYAMFFPVFLTFSWLVFETLEKEYQGKIKWLKNIWQKTGLNFVYLLPALFLGIVSLMTHLLTVNIIFILAIYFLTMMLLSRHCERSAAISDQNHVIENLARQSQSKKSYFNKYSVLLGLGILGFLALLISVPEKLSLATKELNWGIAHFSYLDKVFSDYANALLALGFILLGSFYLWKVAKLKKESLWLSTSFWGVLILAIFFWNRVAGNQYIFFIQSFKIILLSSGVYFAAIFLKDNLKSNEKKAYWATIILSLILLPAWGYFLQKDNAYNQTSDSATPQYRKVFSYVQKKRGDQDALITRNFRSFYFAGAKMPVYNLGGEITKEKLTLERLEKIIEANPTGWIVLSDNDEIFVTKEAAEYITKNLEKVSNSQVRGKVSVYRW